MNKNDKPEGANLGWHLKDTTYPFASKWLKLRQDRIDTPQGEVVYTYLDQRDALAVVPVTSDGIVLLIRQYRYTVDEWCLEVPAGGTHDTGDALLEQVARDELREEIGATAHRLDHVGYFYSSVGNSSQKFHVFLGVNVEVAGKPQLEPTEFIELYPVPVQEALELARSGQIKDGLSALCILMCENPLRELGYL